MNIDALVQWIQALPVNSVVSTHPWMWPAAEILHFAGLAVMFGAVFVFDLRVLGVARGLDLGQLRYYLRWAMAAFLVNATTGAMFFLTFPRQYILNAAFELKVICLLLAGLNIVFFHLYIWPRLLRPLGSQDHAPAVAKLSAVLSMLLLVCIACFGRYTAFYKFLPLGY